MVELDKKVNLLVEAVDAACKQIGIAKLQAEADKLGASMNAPDFWNDNQTAAKTTKQLADLQARIKPWHELQKSIADLQELTELGDLELHEDLNKQLTQLEKDFDNLKTELQFSGQYDDHNVILQIHAGAGGTDAQDWTQMLMRMYVRWAEAHNVNSQVIEQSSGEEAGIKSATLELEGPFVYGKLKGEHGVHRLVRLSPFNADNLRQTSFAKVEVLPVIDKPDELELDDKDLKVDVFRSGGHGGQSVNTTDSAVRITHLPTNITVTIQNERSQLQNKETAMTILRSRLAQLQLEQHKEKLAEIKGPNQSAEWGNQIRSYVLHPYKQVKDLRTKHESKDPDKVLDGDLDGFIKAYLEHTIGQE